MLTQYFKIAQRNILRNKLTSVINIIGLSISMACCVLIISFIKYEFSYDRYHKNADRTYRFTYSVKKDNGYKAHFARCAAKWVNYFPDEFPEVEKMVTLMPYKHITLKVKDEKFSLESVFYADSTFFNVFSIRLLKGDSNRVLSEPNAVVISKSLARKYFCNDDPVGKTIANTGWHDGKQWTILYYTVTGVFEDMPVNSHFHSDIFISKATIHWNSDWDWKYVYLLFHKNAKPADFLKKFPAFVAKHKNDIEIASSLTPNLQCITDIHLKSDKDREIEDNGNMTIIYIIGLVGFIILIISWVNYLNLTIAGVYGRAKNITIFKIHGSPNHSIVGIYLAESFIIISTSLCAAYILIQVFFPTVVSITGNILNGQLFRIVNGIWYWVIILFFGSLIVGSIPSIFFILKSRKTLAQLKLQAGLGKPSAFFRKTLIVFQFSLTVLLIICALTINRQGKYIYSQQSGANQNNVVAINLFNQDILTKFSLIKLELLESPYIKEATAVFEKPYDLTMDAMGFETQGIEPENKDKILWVYSADDNYFKFLKIPIIAGSDFPTYNENLKKEYYILNETAVRELGWTPEEAIGKPFKLKFQSSENIIYGGQIVGVVKDFNLNTLHHEIKPYVFFQKQIWFWNLLVKIDTAHKELAMQHLRKTWDKLAPNYPLEYQYNTDIFFKAYKKEIIQSRLTGFFSLLAIIISCLGLFAISSIIILKRTKEIGIRKVNGADNKKISRLLLEEFSIWVIVAFIIACPVAWYIMHKWLENFAYKIGIEWWIYALAGFAAIMVALITVGWQSWRAASRNPVEALRYE
jgi:putative ABC transport system permease protein